MVGKNNAALIARIGALTTPKITEGKSIDFAGAVDAWRESREKAEQREQKQLAEQKKQAYIKALQGGNQDEINSAMASYNPDAYAQMLKSDAQRAEDRQWELDDAATKHRYDLELEKAKDKEFTTAQRNMTYLQEMGYTPQEAAMLIYGGQNPSLDMAMLGKKGQEKVDESRGEKIAEKEDAADKLQQTKDLYNEFFEKGGLISKAQTGGNQPDTFAGRLRGVMQRNLPNEWVKNEAQTARQQIQYGLGNLRLDESSALKGALSDSEQKFLSDMVAGDVQKYSPAQIKGAMQGLMGKLERKASLKSANSNGADPFGIR